MAEQCCGCQDGRPHSTARELLQDATMRSEGLSESAKHVNVTCAEDATMNEDKQCPQRDVTEADVSRRGAGRTCLMIVMFITSCDMGQWLELKRVVCQTSRTATRSETGSITCGTNAMPD